MSAPRGEPSPVDGESSPAWFAAHWRVLAEGGLPEPGAEWQVRDLLRHPDSDLSRSMVCQLQDRGLVRKVRKGPGGGWVWTVKAKTWEGVQYYGDKVSDEDLMDAAPGVFVGAHEDVGGEDEDDGGDGAVTARVDACEVPGDVRGREEVVDGDTPQASFAEFER